MGRGVQMEGRKGGEGEGGRGGSQDRFVPQLYAGFIPLASRSHTCGTTRPSHPREIPVALGLPSPWVTVSTFQSCRGTDRREHTVIRGKPSVPGRPASWNSQACDTLSLSLQASCFFFFWWGLESLLQ